MKINELVLVIFSAFGLQINLRGTTIILSALSYYRKNKNLNIRSKFFSIEFRVNGMPIETSRAPVLLVACSFHLDLLIFSKLLM